MNSIRNLTTAAAVALSTVSFNREAAAQGAASDAKQSSTPTTVTKSDPVAAAVPAVTVKIDTKQYTIEESSKVLEPAVDVKGTITNVELGNKRSKAVFSVECPKGDSVEAFFKLDPKQIEPGWAVVTNKDGKILASQKIDSSTLLTRLTLKNNTNEPIRIEFLPSDPNGVAGADRVLGAGEIYVRKPIVVNYRMGRVPTEPQKAAEPVKEEPKK